MAPFRLELMDMMKQIGGDASDPKTQSMIGHSAFQADFEHGVLMGHVDSMGLIWDFFFVFFFVTEYDEDCII